MAIKSVKTLERHALSDGRVVYVRKFNRKYILLITHLDGYHPEDDHKDLSKAQAYDMFADVIRKDVLDLD